MQIEERLLASLKQSEYAVLATVLDETFRGRRRLWSKAGLLGGLGAAWLDEAADTLVASLEPGAAWLRCRLTDPANSSNAITVMIEYFFPPDELIIFGGGYLSQALVGLGKQLNYRVTVLEDRPMFANRSLFPEADRIICDNFKRAVSGLSLGAWSSVVIMTRGHQHDMAILEALIERDIGYIGMVGSRRRAAITKQYFSERGIDPAYISRVHMPVGLAIGARTPAEIAVSIAAELIKERYEKASRILAAPAQPGVVLLDSGASDYTPRENMEIFDRIVQGDTNQGAVLAFIASTTGSTPRKAGAKMLLLADGGSAGTIGGGCVEGEVRRKAYEVRETRTAQMITYLLDNEAAAQQGMVCGGRMEILLLPVGRQSAEK